MKFIIVVMLIVLSVQVKANVWHESLVDVVYPFDEQMFIVGLVEDHKDCLNPNGFYRVELDQNGMTQEHLNRIFSLIMLSAAQKNKISIYFNPHDGQCYINRIKFDF